MPIYIRGNSFQVKLLDANGFWITKTFRSRRDAELFEARTKVQRLGGESVQGSGQQPTLDTYFEQWFETVRHQASDGWRSTQKQLYQHYVSPFLGDKRLQKITPPMVSHVLNRMREKGMSDQLQLHVYALLKKMMRDAMELFMILPHNPVLRTMRPKVPTKEARHLAIDELKKLMTHVVGKPYGVAVWLQAFLGLRVGELQALTWGNVDLNEGVIRICRNYIRQEKKFRDYPKGRKQHSHKVPPELLALLKREREVSRNEFVVSDPDGAILRYESYNRALGAYCEELKISFIGTHGLRHSTAELYLANGATSDDLRRLFAHSSSRVTERYIHNKGTRLEEISGSMRLFDKSPPPHAEPTTTDDDRLELSQSFPNNAVAKVISIQRRRLS